ncbi:TPA: hypothetical protein I3311_003107 [Enterobacter hormaechei subsp. xiangfangensis]|nr:hypothetical protein [Enterobacter hormaechei subsp. xiangfangensis]HAS0848053.1 hypothetical protein [Enterobacter hormaechei subsp. xiangfangensis]
MSTLTKEWLLKTIAELEEERDATPGAVNEDAAMALAAMKLALASLEAEAVGEVVLGEYDDCGCHPDAKVVCIAADGQADWENFKDGTRLYTAPPAPEFYKIGDATMRHIFTPTGITDVSDMQAVFDQIETVLAGMWQPAPVSVPDAMEMDDDFDSAFEHGKAVGWNAYRAAMLQSFGNSEQLNSPVIPDGWVLVPEEPTHEMLEAGDEQFGTYDVYRRMIAAAPQQEVK